jgi:hypothetical protein
MTTQTARLQLNTHTLADVFQLSDYTHNWSQIDGSPGVYITTSGAHPVWGDAQLGRVIFETDTKLLWYWDGSAFQRVGGKGLISDLTAGERTTAISTTSTTYQVGTSVTATVIAGGRPHLVLVAGPGVKNSSGLTELGIYRDNTALQEWAQYGGTGGTVAEQPRPVFALALDLPAAGTYNYILNFRASAAFGGTSTLNASTTSPLGIFVVEL